MTAKSAPTRQRAERAPSARRVAFDLLRRIEHEAAYANLVLGPALDSSGLTEQDRRFVTELVYGTTRMRRACDVLVDRFVLQPPDNVTRTLLRLGAYQLAFAGVAPHAAVGETVELAPRKTRGFVNAVLRKVAAGTLDDSVWPSDAARLSYPTWIYDRFVTELDGEAVPAMETMNMAPPVTARDDGYVQDRSSQWVAAAVIDQLDRQRRNRVLDVCAAPGGKATAVASAVYGWQAGVDDTAQSVVVAADQRPHRVGLVADNADRLGLPIPVVVADGQHPPFRERAWDAVIVDAPCSGLGALRRRADARWAIQPSDIEALAVLQQNLIAAAARLVADDGVLVYSVCTLTAQESVDHPWPDGFEVVHDPPTEGTWRKYHHGWRVLPHDADTDGMVVIRYRRSP